MQCTICLDLFKFPVTIPCGHTLCKDCISKFWDGKDKDRQDLICPVCKEKFPTRPQVNRNVSLSVLMEAVAANSAKKRDVFTGAVVHMEPKEFCERHQKPLVIYCRNDLMCVCYECSVKECKGHDQILVEEERNNQEVQKREENLIPSRSKRYKRFTAFAIYNGCYCTFVLHFTFMHLSTYRLF